jgi:MFS transporter, PAT family, beta-lactamase induction signal transducer AmpG
MQVNSLFKAFGNRRIAAVLLLGVSSGIPLALTGSTLQAWMKTENVDLALIGLFSLVGMPYALKFLWSPLLDRFVPPFLGRRRGWILITQLCLILALVGMSFIQPAASPGFMALMAVLVSFFSASQDIVIDAYRTDVLHKDEVGPGASVTTLGYRFGMIISGALALYLSEHMSWQKVYLLMAASILIGVIANFYAPEPEVAGRAPKTLAEAVVKPLLSFLSRKGAYEILAFLIFYKLDAVIATALMTPFMMDVGFSRTDIAAVTKVFGIFATLAGTVLGGVGMVRFGLKRSLWIFGLAQGISGLSFMFLAIAGHSYPMMVASIAAENICSGMGSAAYTGFMMSICDKRYTATQYALLTSIMALTRVIGAAPTGWMAKSLGWEMYFVVSVIAMAPGLLILSRYDRWTGFLPEFSKETL